MKKTNAKKPTHPALQTIPVQIMTEKLAREANAPVSPAYELLALKEITEALATAKASQDETVTSKG